MYADIADPDRRTYASMVSYMDASIGAVIDALKARQMWSNTLMIFMSDNGGSLNYGAGMFNKPFSRLFDSRQVDMFSVFTTQ